MAGPNLTQNVDSTYADTGDPSVAVHQIDHDFLHAQVGVMDVGLTSPTDGYLMTGNASGLWTQTARTSCFTFTQSGNLTVGSIPMRLYNDTGRTLTITSTRASVGTAPTGTVIWVDVNINGASIWSASNSRIMIAQSNFTGTGDAPEVTSTITNGQYFTVDIDQVGSTINGSNLTVQIWTVG